MPDEMPQGTPDAMPTGTPDKVPTPMPSGEDKGTYKCPVEGLSDDARLPNTKPAAPDPQPFGSLR